VISIDVPGDKDANVRRFLDVTKLPFPSGQDTTGAICKLYGVESTPTSVFITTTDPEVDPETRSANRAASLNLKMDALSLQSRAVEEMLGIDPIRARELFAQMTAPAIVPASCEDSLLPDVSPYYEALTAVVEGAPRRMAHAMLHPGDASKGNRELPFEGTALLPKSEIVPDAAMVRLKDLFNVKIAWDGETPTFSYGGDSLADARALMPGLAVFPADPSGDIAALARLADWCRYPASSAMQWARPKRCRPRASR